MRYLFIFILAVLTCCTSGQHYAGNPVIKGWYADPEGLIFNNEYWIFPTYSAPYKEQVYIPIIRVDHTAIISGNL